MITKEAIADVPTTNGIYIFRNGAEILYIGKSINLKARLTSHIENAKIDAKEAGIIEGSNKVQYIITDSEFKALLLESELIQKHRPKFNVRWRDDKSYLYIKITIKDDYPKLYPTRRENDGKSLYFGPFPYLRSVLEIVRELRKIFPFCTQKKVSKRACFYSKIGQCLPCPNVIEHTTDTAEKVRLKREYKSNIREIIKILRGNTDSVLKDLYKELKELTKEEKFEEALIVRNKIWRFERLLHERSFASDTGIRYNQSEESMKQLNGLLRPYFPQLTELKRIECFDISNTSQKDATASMVVLTEGLVDKSQYRKFKIKDLKLQSDFEMIEETLKRRFRNKWEKPSLLVIDGGKPQVRIVEKVMAELGETVPFIGIAKSPDRLVIGVDGTPIIRPSFQNLGFNMVRGLRDEAHRFAKKYHTHLRDKKFLPEK